MSALLFAILTLAASGCGADSSIRVTERDFSVDLSRSMLPSGEMSFVVRNEGPSDHEFVILRTDLPAGSLPIRDGEWVDESATGIEIVGEFDHVLAGKTKTLRVDLVPGRYVALSNAQGDYQKGMYASFTVK